MDCARFFHVLVVVGLLSARQATAADVDSPDRNQRTVYFTTGDHQDLLGLPLDSAATIEAAFDALHHRYRVSRIWWRGGQDEVWGNQFVIRPENRQFARIWQWWKHLAYEGVGTNRIAVKAARSHGMQIWMAYGLFDNGSAADVGYVGFPYAAEDRIRVQNPDWAPVNRFGTWRQGGPIEFAYPGARQAVVAYLTKYTVSGGYDGMAFLTYAENYSQRYEDEFGFNPPIVDEFRKRHGIDIRTQPFDKAAWSRLRGEYLTQFLRELRTAFARHGKKIAVCVDGKEPYLPSAWNVDGGVRTAGRIHLDLETWVKKNLVDELNVYAPSTEEAIAKVHDICRGSKTQASVFRTRGPMPEGSPRIMFLGPDIESGFDWENHIDYPDEKVPAQPAKALQGEDAFARRRLMTAVVKKKQQLPVAVIVTAAKDKDIYVRRAALRALGVLGDSAAVPAVAAALRDPENSVRWQAALTLAQLSDPQCVPRLIEAVRRDDSTFQFQFRAVPEALLKLQANGRLGPKEKEHLSARLTADDAKMREVVLYCFQRVGAPATPEVEDALLQILRNDESPYAREMALVNLRSSFGATPRVVSAIREAMKDKDQSVQVRAAVVLAAMYAGSPAKERADVLRELITFFRQYGDGCQRVDEAWGWREIGAALLTFGADGRKEVVALLKEKKDRRLAELAWRILYLPQGDKFHRLTEAEDREAHSHHPFLRQAGSR